MPKLFMIALVLGCLAAAASGCGEGNGGSGSRPDPARLLLTVHQLPGAVATGEEPPEICGPLPILEKQDGDTAISGIFDVKSVRVAEAAGIFDSLAKARARFDELGNRAQIECISEAIAGFTSAASVRFT